MAFWTHYGRWSDDGLTVLGPYGNVVYDLAKVERLLAGLKRGVSLRLVGLQEKPLRPDGQGGGVVVHGEDLSLWGHDRRKREFPDAADRNWNRDSPGDGTGGGAAGK